MKKGEITMAYVWSDDLATGYESIDTQHKKLVKAINDLLNACSGGQGRSHLDTVIKFLMDYIIEHFKDEENLQQKYAYPDHQNHKKLHDGFKAVVEELAKRLQANGPSVGLVSEVNTRICSWLNTHIKNEDKKIANHIRSLGA